MVHAIGNLDPWSSAAHEVRRAGDERQVGLRRLENS
jgi:hypothetical protein